MLSVIVYGRNDSHGYNLHKRAAISLNCIAEVLTHPDDELIFVDYNTPIDMPTFPEAIRDTFTETALRKLRVLRVPPAIHDEKYGGRTHLVAVEPLARNIAIRRANPRNRWLLSTNTDMIFLPRVAGKSLSDVVAPLSEGFYELPRFELPEALWESLDRKAPRDLLDKLRCWGRELHLNMSVLSGPVNRYDAPGDFQLFTRDMIHAIHGFNESMILGWHCDSNICKRMNLLTGETRSLLDEVFGYHCNHFRVATVMHRPNRKENDLFRFVSDLETPFIPEQAETWGLPETRIEEVDQMRGLTARFVATSAALLTPAQSPYYEVDVQESGRTLVYNPQRTIPYLGDHITPLPQDAGIAYLGINPTTLSLLAAFLKGLGHPRKLMYIPELLHPSARNSLERPEHAEPATPEQMYATGSLFVADVGIEEGLVNGNIPSDLAGYTVACRRGIGDVMSAAGTLVSLAARDAAVGARNYRKLVVHRCVNTLFEEFISDEIATIRTSHVVDIVHGYLGTVGARGDNAAVRWRDAARSVLGIDLSDRPPRGMNLPVRYYLAATQPRSLWDGWRRSEPYGARTNGAEAYIEIMLNDPPATELIMSLSIAQAVFAGRQSALRVFVDLDDKEIESWQFTSPTRPCAKHIVIPSGVAGRNSTIHLRLRIPDALPPHGQAAPAGSPLPGLLVSAIVLDRAAHWGSPVSFALHRARVHLTAFPRQITALLFSLLASALAALPPRARKNLLTSARMAIDKLPYRLRRKIYGWYRGNVRPIIAGA